MKIDINQIPQEGLTLIEEFSPAALDLETEIVKFCTPLRVTADITKITNAVAVHLEFSCRIRTVCSRCLEEFDSDLKKSLDLNFSADKSVREIDLNPEIREEIIIDYPVKPLCKEDCKGLCFKCGNNLNEEKCDC